MPRAISIGPVDRPLARRPQRQRISGRLVELEPLDPDVHAETLYALSHQGDEGREIWAFLPDGPFDDVVTFQAWVGRCAGEPDRIAYAVCDKTTKRAAGMATYLDIRPSHGGIEMGYIWFAPQWQRTPKSTEACFLMLRHAFDELGYRRMQWRCNALNEKSRAAAVRLGFTCEGIFYQHMVVKGRNRDTAWYSILDGEWPRLRANFETWLGVENFDAQGHQRRSLGAMNAMAT